MVSERPYLLYGTHKEYFLLDKDKHEIDRMTLTMNVELPDTFSIELRQLLEGLLQVND